MRRFGCLLLVLVVAITGCKSAAKRNQKPATAQAKKDAQTTEANADMDFQAFLSRLRKAVQTHDMNTLASMMTSDFAYVMGSSSDQDRKGEGVFKYWDDNGLWPELEGIVTEKFTKKEDFMVAPPQFANPAVAYDGYRAGIRRVNGSWKFAYFVNG
jgi:hypothetical protein